MAILKRSPNTKRVLDLSGPDGNAFVLLSIARNLGNSMGFAKEEAAAVEAEMTSGNYENLIQVFDRHFGSFVDLVRPEPEDEDDF